MQVKNLTQLYSKLLVRALSHQDLRMRLVAMIAMAEASIDNLGFQMKVMTLYILIYSEEAFNLMIYFLLEILNN
jgi:hypothetical protein